MTQFLPIRGTSAQIHATPIVDGQLLFEISNPNGQNHVYIDVDDDRFIVGLSDWIQLTNKPFKTIGRGLSVDSSGTLSADFQSWDDISAKPFERIGSGLSVVDGTLNANVIIPRWSEIENKPFSSIGSGLTVSSNVLSADVRSVSCMWRNVSDVNWQEISIDMNGTTVDSEVCGSKYIEDRQTLSTTENTIYSFNSYHIQSSSAVDVFTDVWGIEPINVNISQGECTVTFAPQDSAISMLCRIYIK